MICNNCGKFVPDGTRYCDVCGMQQLGSTPPAETVSDNLPLETPEESGGPLPVAVGFEDAPTGPLPDHPVSGPSSDHSASGPSPDHSASGSSPDHSASGSSAPAATAPPPRALYYRPEPEPPYRYRALSPGQYILFFLLMLIPAVNFILIVAWSFSERINENRRNLARAMLALTFVVLVALLCGLAAYALGALPFRAVEIRLIP